VKRLILICLLFLGCEEIIQAPAYPGFSIQGRWYLHFENDWIWELTVDSTTSHFEYGYIRPDTSTEWWWEVLVTRHPGYKTFGMTWIDAQFVYQVSCIIEPGHRIFNGKIEFYDRFNGLLEPYYALFYATRVD